MHVKDEHDFRLYYQNREEVIEHLKECYFSLMQVNLPIYGVPGEIEKYITTKKNANKPTPFPDKKFRMSEEDIYEPLDMN